MKPLPQKITQDEIQCTRFEGNLQFDSPYYSNADDIYIKAHTQRYISASAEMTFLLDSELFYSQNTHVKPHGVRSFYIHYACPISFLSLLSNEREVIINHHAPSRIQERITASNTGAEFTGELNAFKNLVC